MKPCKRLSVCFLCLLVLFFFPLSVWAAGQIDLSSEVSLSVSYLDQTTPLAGASFSVYLVADVDAYGTLTPTSAFAPYYVDLQDQDEQALKTMATTLEGYVLRDKIPAADSGQTDNNGLVRFPSSGKHLSPGLYLVLGQSHTQNGSVYHAAPFMVLLPEQDKIKNEWNYDVTAYVKHSSVPEQPDTISRKVLKVWEDSGAESERPDQITVQLLKNGTVFDTVTLNAKNNWRYTWHDLDATSRWTVVEKTPAGYTVSLSQEGTTFVLTNTLAVPAGPTSSPQRPSSTLPQTGQLWWPVPVLACAGMLFVILGILCKKGGSDET